MKLINSCIQFLALRYLKYNAVFIKNLLNTTSSKALNEAYITDSEALLAVIYKLREHIISITDEFPQSTNKDHVERTIDALHKNITAENGIFIDVGAAAGDVAEAFLNAFPNNKFHLFEPLSMSYQGCVKRFQNNPNIKVHQKAVGAVNEQTIIHKSKSSDSSSLLNFSKNLSVDFFKEHITADIDEPIGVVRLDDYLAINAPIWLIKIDIQGYEIPALVGAKNLLKQTRFVLCEMMNHDNYVDAPQYYDIDQHLRNEGFKLLDMSLGLRREGKLQEFDSLYYNSALLNL